MDFAVLLESVVVKSAAAARLTCSMPWSTVASGTTVGSLGTPAAFAVRALKVLQGGLQTIQGGKGTWLSGPPAGPASLLSVLRSLLAARGTAAAAASTLPLVAARGHIRGRCLTAGVRRASRAHDAWRASRVDVVCRPKKKAAGKGVRRGGTRNTAAAGMYAA